MAIYSKSSECKLNSWLECLFQFIPLHPCDYLNKISNKIKVATDEGDSRNETWH